MDWEETAAEIERTLAITFDVAPVRASMSFLGVEEMTVLRFAAGDGQLIYVTVGMAREVMTPADATLHDENGPRAELILRVRDWDARYGDVWRNLAVLAAAPAVEGVLYVEDASVDLGQPLATGATCFGALVLTSDLAAIPLVAGSSAVTLFELAPATPNELAWARVRGGAALRELWRERGTDLRDLGRASVALPTG